MVVWRVIYLVIMSIGLWSCADARYVYDYDPYHGPRGRYLGPHEQVASPAPPCAYVMAGPYYGGWRGPYEAGPYCVAPAAPAAAVVRP